MAPASFGALAIVTTERDHNRFLLCSVESEPGLAWHMGCSGTFMKLKKRWLLIMITATSLATASQPVPPLPDDPAATAQDRIFMKRANELAEAAVKHGNHPFGALLVKDGKIIFEFENCIYTSKDATKHAETGLISAATPKFDRATLAACTLYTSTEPCIMCCGAIHWAGVPKIVYGVTALQLTRVIGFPDPKQPLAIREIFERTAPGEVIIGPLIEEEGLAIHAAYWPHDPIYGHKSE